MKVMASGPITSWQIDGEIVESVTDFIFLGFKITADGNCNHKIKRHLLLGGKTMTNLDSILKSRDQKKKKVETLFAKTSPYSQRYGFSSSHVWMWELDIKKAEHWKIDALELWCWRRFLRVPWMRSNQLILK